MTLRTAVTTGASLSSLAGGGLTSVSDDDLPAAGSAVGATVAAAVTFLDRTVAI